MLVTRLRVCWKERWWRGREKRKVLPFGLGLRLSLEMCPELLVMEGFSPAILPAEGSDFFLLWVKLTNWQVWNADHGKEVSRAGRTHLWAHHCHWAWMAKPALLHPPTLQAITATAASLPSQVVCTTTQVPTQNLGWIHLKTRYSFFIYDYNHRHNMEIVNFFNHRNCLHLLEGLLDLFFIRCILDHHKILLPCVCLGH